MTSGLKKSRISEEHRETSIAFNTLGQVDVAGDQLVCEESVCELSLPTPPTRIPDAASATTAHPSVDAMSAAAKADAAPSEAPPATTSTPFFADFIKLTSDCIALTSA